MEEAPFRGFFFVRKTAKIGIAGCSEFSEVDDGLADQENIRHAATILLLNR